MRLREIIFERYINVFSESEKELYASDVLDLINTAYAKIGGHFEFQDVDSLINNTNMWKMVRKNGEIILAIIYKDKQGRKLVAVGNNGTNEAKDALRKIFSDDIKNNRMWAEVSGSMAKFCLKSGIPPVENTYAETLLGKEILGFSGKYKYTRIIADRPVEKIIVGYPNGDNLSTNEITDELIASLT